jgi:hypothetical protein
METCRNCRYSKLVSTLDPQVAEILCKREYLIDYVSGCITYAKCESVRDPNCPDCPNWERGGIKGFFQRLYKRFRT